MINGSVDRPVADGSSVLVIPSVALAQQRVERQAHEEVEGPEVNFGPDEGGGGELQLGRQEPLPGALSHFFGRLDVQNPARLAAVAGSIAAELIPHLAAARGSSLRITIEIEAEGPNFNEETRRVVTENARTLGLDPAEFD